jgi:glycosyltransferase involved in cell wall biosynthesis
MLILPFFTFKDDIVLSINNFGPLWGKPSQFRILVIHDVWFMSPEYDGGQLQKLLFSNLMRLQIKYCSQIITVSDFSRREISHFFNVPLSKIKIVSNCMGKNIEARSNTETNNSLLLIGSDRKNKNVIRTISGFCHFKNSCPDSPVKLIVVGKYSESFFNKIRSSFPGHLSDIKLAGYIDNAKLESLYRQCSGVLFLSLYEGFGLPAIEGLLFGKPVLVSQNTACAELLESFAISVDATDIASISEGIEMLITSKVDTLSPEFQIFQNKFMRCNGPADALTSILSGTEQ